MIDKNGKLFGKISIIDIVVVVLLLAAASFVLYKFGIFTPSRNVAASTEKVRITFYQEEVNSFTAENVKLQEPVRDTLLNVGLGTIVDIVTGDSVSWGIDKNGRQVLSTKEGYSSIYIKAEAPGTTGPNGITIGGYKYYIGDILSIRAGTSTFYVRIDAVEQIA